jgi:glycosyltransferase involved in cell wall biosynthesis
MTSKYEGMPITIIEALKYNIPVLSSNVGGITEYLPSKNLYMNSNEAIGKILKKNYEKNIVYSDPDMAKKYAELYLNG